MVDGQEWRGAVGYGPANGRPIINAAEMKRLYVRQPFRRLGRAPVNGFETVLDTARIAGYHSVYVAGDMESARALYHELGFTDVHLSLWPARGI
jgi:GNAT superfamily N-acetyltransferase